MAKPHTIGWQLGLLWECGSAIGPHQALQYLLRQCRACQRLAVRRKIVNHGQNRGRFLVSQRDFQLRAGRKPEFGMDLEDTMAKKGTMSFKVLPAFAFRFLTFACVLAPGFALAEPQVTTDYNSYGYPGLIDMPVATSRPDSELAWTTSSFAGQTRNTLSFQILPRLSGSFRYTQLRNYPSSRGVVTNYDRSFSLHYRLLDENPRSLRPAVAIGLNDFLGTGIYSSEYVVVTKTVTPRLRFSAGLGWGRLGTSGGFKNPLSIFSDRLETRPARDTGQGGTVDSGPFFRGDAALFGGIEWQASERLKFTLEYSSDAYPRESRFAVDRDSQLNIGATYKIRPNLALSMRYLYGSEFGVQLSAALNPKSPPDNAGRDPAPPPILMRETHRASDLGWTGRIAEQTTLQTRLSEGLDQQGMRLHGFTINTDTARVEIENLAYRQEAQAVGRAARVLSRELPASVNRFEIVMIVSGLPVTEVKIKRSDMEVLEHDLEGSWKSFARARIKSPKAETRPVPDRYPHFDWGLKPYLSPSFFDPDDPLRADVGGQLDLSFQPAPGFELSASVRQKVFGNLDESTRQSTSVLPRVRSDFNIYDREGETALTNMTAAHYFKPGKDFYARVTGGYLERMFGGVSSEVLWKRNDSPFALGVEVNYAKQRDFDGGFGFQDYEVATGHASAYWDIGNGFHAQVDAGRYLAGDWGATFSLDREFNNGWKIGAFATLTDVPFNTFGEGSFDKGIRITMPISWLIGEPNKAAFSQTIRTIQRDGGARLNVPGRLYDRVRSVQEPALQDGWGRFWR